MKLNETKKISQNCGISKVLFQGDEIYVVFMDTSTNDFEGEIIGKGLSMIEAYEDSLKNISKNVFDFVDFYLNQIDIGKVDKKGIWLDKLMHFNHEPIIPLDGVDYVERLPDGSFKDHFSGKMVNGHIGFESPSEPFIYVR